MGKSTAILTFILHECVREYAFWLFAFEWLNGILGSFHTNNHDISLQIMRQFIRSYEFGIQTICSEYKHDFLPLIQKCFYNKGYLKQTSLDIAESNISAIPPLYASSLNQVDGTNLLPTICKFLCSVEESTITVLAIYQKCNSLNVGGFLLGSIRGRHQISITCTCMPSK